MHVAIVTGHRWSGKTTACRQLHRKGIHWINLDGVYNPTAAAINNTGRNIMALDKDEILQWFSEAFAKALPRKAPAAIVTDGFLYGHDPIFVEAFEAAVRRYGIPYETRLFMLDVSEDELQRHYNSIREEFFISGGQKALDENFLNGFKIFYPEQTDEFEKIKDIDIVEKFLLGEQRSTIPPEIFCVRNWYQSYDFPSFRTAGQSDSPAKWRLIKQNLPPMAGCSLIDVGCNQGYFSLRAAEAGAVVTGIDLDSEAIHAAVSIRDQLLSDASAKFVVSDISDLPKLGTFEYSFCLSVLHLVPFLDTVRKVARVTTKVAFLEAIVDRRPPPMEPYFSLSDNPNILEVLPNPRAFEAVLARHFSKITMLNPGRTRLLAKCEK